MYSLVEEMILNEEYLERYPGARMYRVEWSGRSALPEGRLWLMPSVDPDAVERALNGLEPWTPADRLK